MWGIGGACAIVRCGAGAVGAGVWRLRRAGFLRLRVVVAWRAGLAVVVVVGAGAAGVGVVWTGERVVTTAAGFVTGLAACLRAPGAGSGRGPPEEDPLDGAASGPDGDCARAAAGDVESSSAATIATQRRCGLAPIS